MNSPGEREVNDIIKRGPVKVGWAERKASPVLIQIFSVPCTSVSALFVSPDKNSNYGKI